VPRGLLSLLAPLWLTAFLTAGVWLAAGVAAALVTLGVVGTGALLAADWVLDDPDPPAAQPDRAEPSPPRRWTVPASQPERQPAARRLTARLRQLGASVPRPRPVPRARYLLAGAVGMLVAAMLLLVAVQSPAQAETSTTAPMTITMEEAGDGLTLVGDDGPENDSILLVKDHLDQPIFSILEAGGAAVLGDDFRILDPNLHARVTLSMYEPNPAVCVANGLLWIGGADGRVWRCADLDGGTWNGAWWVAL
jgi:hypothetical protein